MVEFDPTPAQQRVIDDADGITVVDAGAGTGKTFTITRRYTELVNRSRVTPEDILLVTFTRTAADEARERIVSTSSASPVALRQAPIDTFHGIAHELLLEYAHDAPTYLGIDERITESTQLLEDQVIEADRFRSFYRQFVAEHPEYRDYFALVSDPTALLSLIRQLCAKGVFPTDDGWYRDGRSVLLGDFDAFQERFHRANQPNEGERGPTQSDLRANLSSYDRNGCYREGAPSKVAIRGESGRKSVDDAWAERAFNEDREELLEFVHDIYFAYLQFATERNYLNFGFLQLFAYVLLVEDHAVREEFRFPYVIVDEFQDTSELQFKLVLLLAGSDTLCVVGDWKQSIYGFQYAEVENIQRFEKRIQQFTAELNTDYERIPFPVDDVTRISLTANFRSTQSILDLAERGLTFPATVDEDPWLDEELIPLDSQVDHGQTQLHAIQSAEQVDAVLSTVRSIVGSSEYEIRQDDGGMREPTYDDIAVITRKRDFGRRLRSRATDVGVPVAYEGGVDLFGTDQGILLLAWLRIVSDTHNRRGWAVILEEAGYRIDEIERILETGAYPAAFTSFRDKLTSIDRIGTLARSILARYGFRDAYADSIIAELERIHDDDGGTLGDLVRYIERSIDIGATFEVVDSPAPDAVTIQTIHAAKGLEYPIVILADLSRYAFPPTRGESAPIRFTDPIGLRQTAMLADDHGNPHVYDNWRYRLLSATLRGKYDEERRLLYVAMTRAEDHLIVTADDEPSPFFTAMPIPVRQVEPELEITETDPTGPQPLSVEMPPPRDPIQLTAHDLLDESVFEGVTDGRGTAYGSRIHEFAERYAKGAETRATQTDDERHITEFLDSRSGSLQTEVPVTLPLTVDEQAVTISGQADLLHSTDGAIEIVDYKTDSDRHALSEYQIQLSVYYHVITAVNPADEVTVTLFYTREGEAVPVEPLERAELEKRIRARLPD